MKKPMYKSEKLCISQLGFFELYKLVHFTCQWRPGPELDENHENWENLLKLLQNYNWETNSTNLLCDKAWAFAR